MSAGNQERRRLSSPATMAFKYLLPTVWTLVGLPALAVAVFDPSLPFSVLGPCLWAAFAAVILVFYAPLKHLDVDQDSLYISDSSKTVEVRLSSVFAVDDPWGPMPATVTLREPCKFGTKIRFFPAKFPCIGSRASSVRELEQLAAKARRGKPTE